MEDSTTNQPQDCGCTCEECTANNHQACNTGTCQYKKDDAASMPEGMGGDQQDQAQNQPQGQ